MQYKTSMDKLAKGITIGVAVLFVIIMIAEYAIIKYEGSPIPIFISIAFTFIYFIVYAFRPISYAITSEELIIHRLIKDVRITKASIKRVGLLDKEKIKGSIHTFGVGGLFGYFGNFTNRTMGSMVWYATRRDKTVLVLTTNNKKIILTPDEPAAFVSGMNKPG